RFRPPAPARTPAAPHLPRCSATPLRGRRLCGRPPRGPAVAGSTPPAVRLDAAVTAAGGVPGPLPSGASTGPSCGPVLAERCRTGRYINGGGAVRRPCRPGRRGFGGGGESAADHPSALHPLVNLHATL